VLILQGYLDAKTNEAMRDAAQRAPDGK
jgi:hypothetical protein